jgi:hypothetical protein
MSCFKEPEEHVLLPCHISTSLLLHLRVSQDLPPTFRYPECCATPGVVSQIPELDTKSSFAPVASCSKIVCTTPFRSSYEVRPLVAAEEDEESVGRAVHGWSHDSTRPARIWRGRNLILSQIDLGLG